MTRRQGRFGRNLAKISYKSRVDRPTFTARPRRLKPLVASRGSAPSPASLSSLPGSHRPHRASPSASITPKIDLDNAFVYYDPARDTSKMFPDLDRFGPTILDLWTDIQGGVNFTAGNFPVGKKIKILASFYAGIHLGNMEGEVDITIIHSGKSRMITFSDREFYEIRLIKLLSIHKIMDASGKIFEVSSPNIKVSAAHKKYMSEESFGKYFR